MLGRFLMTQVFRVPETYFTAELPPSRQTVPKKLKQDSSNQPQAKQKALKPEFSDDSDEDVFVPPSKSKAEDKLAASKDQQQPTKEEKTKPKENKKKIVYVDQDSDDSDWKKDSDSDD